MANPVDLVPIDIYRGSTFDGAWTITDGPDSISAPRFVLRNGERGPAVFDSDVDVGSEITVLSMASVNVNLYGETTQAYAQEELFYELYVTDDSDDRQYAISHGPALISPST